MKNIKKFWGSLALGFVLFGSASTAKAATSIRVTCSDGTTHYIIITVSKNDFETEALYNLTIRTYATMACGGNSEVISYTYVDWEELEPVIPEKPDPSN